MKSPLPIASGILTISVIIITFSSRGNDKDQISAMNDIKALLDIIQSPIESADPSFISRTNCYLWHNPDTLSPENILGPPLTASKFRFYKAYPEMEELSKTRPVYPKT